MGAILLTTSDHLSLSLSLSHTHTHTPVLLYEQFMLHTVPYTWLANRFSTILSFLSLDHRHVKSTARYRTNVPINVSKWVVRKNLTFNLTEVACLFVSSERLITPLHHKIQLNILYVNKTKSHIIHKRRRLTTQRVNILRVKSIYTINWLNIQNCIYPFLSQRKDNLQFYIGISSI